jgi:hypothetical protein
VRGEGHRGGRPRVTKRRQWGHFLGSGDFFFQMKYIYFSYKTVHTHNTVYKMIMIIHHCCSFVVFVIFVIVVVVLSIGTCTSRLNMNSHE